MWTTTRQAADAVAPIACRGFAGIGETELPEGRERAYQMPILVLFDKLTLDEQFGDCKHDAVGHQQTRRCGSPEVAVPSSALPVCGSLYNYTKFV
jgi:hypothetical protein